MPLLCKCSQSPIHPTPESSRRTTNKQKKLTQCNGTFRLNSYIAYAVSQTPSSDADHAWPLTPLASAGFCCSSTDFNAFIGAGLRMRVASINPALGFRMRPKPGRSSVLTSRKPFVGIGSFKNLQPCQLIAYQLSTMKELTNLQTQATPTCHPGCSPSTPGTASWPATRQSGTSTVHWHGAPRGYHTPPPWPRS